jgi:hypothetical protein
MYVYCHVHTDVTQPVQSATGSSSASTLAGSSANPTANGDDSATAIVSPEAPPATLTLDFPLASSTSDQVVTSNV